MKLTLAIVVTFISMIVSAQKKSDITRLFFNYGIGYHHQSFTGINSKLVNRPEYQKLGGHIFSANAGWNVERNHLLFDINFVFGNSFTGDADRRSSSVNLFSTALNLGYNLLNSKNIRIYPFAGVSYHTYQAKLNKDVSSISFDSVLQSNSVQQRTEPVTFTNGLLCYGAGLGIHFIKQKGRHMRSFGIRASYSGSFGEETWRINETQLLQNAPSDKVKQFNVSLQIGLGRSKSGT